MRTPTRFETTPTRILRRGRLCRLKKASSAAASASGSRTSPPTTRPGARSSRAAFVRRGLPLFTTTAAASWEEPILSPTTCLWRVALDVGVALGAVFAFAFDFDFGFDFFRRPEPNERER